MTRIAPTTPHAASRGTGSTRAVSSAATGTDRDHREGLLRSRRRSDRTLDLTGLRGRERAALSQARRREAQPLAPERTRVVWDPATGTPRREVVPAVQQPLVKGFRSLARQLRAVIDALAPLFAALARLVPPHARETAPTVSGLATNGQARRTNDDQRAPGHPPALVTATLAAAPNAPGC